MKIKAIMLLFSTCFFFACNSSSEKVANQNDSAKVEVPKENKMAAKYEVEGMVCAHGCAKFIEKEVANLNGVLSFEVNFEESTADIIYDKSKTSSREIIEFVEKLNKGQYKLNELTASSEGDTENSANAAKVSEIPSVKNFTISFPKLITYFMHRL